MLHSDGYHGKPVEGYAKDRRLDQAPKNDQEYPIIVTYALEAQNAPAGERLVESNSERNAFEAQQHLDADINYGAASIVWEYYEAVKQ